MGTRARIAKVERYSGSSIYSVTASAPARVVPVVHLVVSRPARSSLGLSSLRPGVDPDRSSPLPPSLTLSLSPSVPVVVQISQAAFILRLSDILYSLSLLGPPLLDTRVPYVMKRGPAPCRDALQEANGVREGPRVPSLTYWTVYTPCVFMAPDYTCLSLSLSLSRDIYIYISYIKQCTSNAMLPPSNGDKPKRCNAYEARDTNNTKRRERISSRESRDFPSRGFRLFRDTEREGGLFSIAWNSIGEGRGYKGLSGIWHGVSL